MFLEIVLKLTCDISKARTVVQVDKKVKYCEFGGSGGDPLPNLKDNQLTITMTLIFDKPNPNFVVVAESGSSKKDQTAQAK